MPATVIVASADTPPVATNLLWLNLVMVFRHRIRKAANTNTAKYACRRKYVSSRKKIQKRETISRADPLLDGPRKKMSETAAPRAPFAASQTLTVTSGIAQPAVKAKKALQASSHP